MDLKTTIQRWTLFLGVLQVTVGCAIDDRARTHARGALPEKARLRRGVQHSYGGIGEYLNMVRRKKVEGV